MIGYITIGTNDLERASSFCDIIFNEMGAARAFDADRLSAWSFGGGKPLFTVTKPFDESEATVGNGVMVALAASSQEDVDKLHAKALALGGTSEGGPYPAGYALVIFTDEPLLDKDTVSDYLQDCEPPCSDDLSSIYFLISYDPEMECCPFFQIK
ncbi:VOC family protein [Kistimonas asteriae]|uniref:VOC family protein n=1 Tax=Kistimonas asteriae TaxID=517724 RepID=UPI001BAC6053|nr:VOC family protein [Kistimonas asteriae]